MTSETEDAVARLRRHAVGAYGDLEDDLLFAIETLTTSQAEVERLGRYAEMGQACEAHGLAEFTPDGLRFQPPAEVIAEAAEARATRAEGLLAEAGEVLGLMRAAFCAPLPRRAMGGHDPRQQEATLAARAFLDKLKEQGQ